MKEEISRIHHLFSEAAEGNNWTGINVLQALNEVSATNATRRINKEHLNIAELVAHLTCWNTVITQRLGKLNYQPAKEDDFPVIHDLSDEEWENRKYKFLQSFHVLQTELENKTDSMLNEPMVEGGTSAYRNLHGQLSHIHYHLGQIVLLKKLLS